MTIKKILLILVIFGVTMSLFGYGQKDGYGKRSQDLKDLIESREKVTLTGNVIISNRVFPELKAGNDLYKLMVPRYCLADPEITDNTEATLEGVILKVKQGVHTRFLNEGDEILFVTKAIINGEEYSPEQESGQCPGPGQGRWGGRMGHGMGHGYRNPQGPGYQDSPLDIFE